MRDRLVELIKEHIRSLHLCDSATYFFEGGVKSLADHLLANGVIVPPCKVGDVVMKYVIDRLPSENVVKVKQGEILLPLSIEELRHLINDAVFYLRMMENRNRNKAELGYFSRQELLEKLRNVERYYEMLNMPVCKAEDEGGADDEETNEQRTVQELYP